MLGPDPTAAHTGGDARPCQDKRRSHAVNACGPAVRSERPASINAADLACDTSIPLLHWGREEQVEQPGPIHLCISALFEPWRSACVNPYIASEMLRCLQMVAT
jgi:hypothetical protein